MTNVAAALTERSRGQAQDQYAVVVADKQSGISARLRGGSRSAFDGPFVVQLPQLSVDGSCSLRRT
jgi:hypothetical protein